jgi:nucleoside 2-deoxyribosyltransferase
MTKKIYIASAWKMQAEAINLAQELRTYGFEVFCFCETDAKHYSFDFRTVDNPDQKDAFDLLDDPRSRKAFVADIAGLDWADTVILLVPSGRSAHLEAGYAKGKGKRLYIYGGFPKGEWDVMYHLADGIYEGLEAMVKRMME